MLNAIFISNDDLE